MRYVRNIMIIIVAFYVGGIWSIADVFRLMMMNILITYKSMFEKNIPIVNLLY